MEADIWLRLAVVAIMMVLSAIFSSMESAYFSLSRAVIESMRDSLDPRSKRVARLLDSPHHLLATFLAGNTIVNTSSAAVAALIALDIAEAVGFSPEAAVAVEVIVISFLMLFLAELTPKLLSLKDPQNWAIKGAGIVSFFNIVLYPIAFPLAAFTSQMSKLFDIGKQSMMSMSEEEIRALVQVGHEKGALELEERKMIHSIFEFGDTIVREVMVPRIDMVAVAKNATLEEVLETVVSKGHSRIPVYDEKIDNITGLIYAKDLLRVTKDSPEFELEKLIRPAYFIPEEKKIDDLLREFQKEKVHFAVVVDEYGGTAGIVTLEDVLEEIVGEIQDEYDTEEPMIEIIDEKTLVVRGRVLVDDFNQELDFELIPESEAYDTVAGFVYVQLGEVPVENQEFNFGDYRFVIAELDGKRIESIRVIHENGVFEDDGEG
ncbi:hemolysin family protein [Calditrichota bacterium]